MDVTKMIETSKVKTSFIIFVFFLLLNLASAGGHLDGYDGIVYFLYTENMVIHHSLEFHSDLPSIKKLDFDFRQYAAVSFNRIGEILPNGNFIPPFYPAAEILLSAMAVPFYEISLLLSLPPINFVPFLLNPTILSGTSLIIFLYASKMYHSEKIGFIIALVFSVTSFVWPYNTTMFNIPLVGFLLILSLYFLYKGIRNEGRYSIELSAISLGLIPLAHPGYTIIILPILGYVLYSLRTKKMKIFIFLIILIFFALVIISVNYYKFGSFFNFGFGEAQSISEWHKSQIGLAGLLFSPGFGLFFFYPLAILFPISIYLLYKREKSIALLYAFVFLTAYFFFGTVHDPDWSGNAWGPRYFVALVPFISVSFGIIVVDRTRIKDTLFIVLSTVGFVINFLGKITWYLYGLSYAWEREELWKIPHNNNLITWNVNYSPIILNLKTLMSDYIQTLSLPHSVGDYHYVGLAPCPVDSYLYCKFGILPEISIICIILLMTYFLWNRMFSRKVI